MKKQCENFVPTIGCFKDICSCNKEPKKPPFKHECRVLSKEEVLSNRSDAYEFIDFDKQDTPEEETLAKIKFVLSTNNDTQAIRLLEQYKEWQQEQILDFLYSEITERRDYSASKMCYKVIEFIKNN